MGSEPELTRYSQQTGNRVSQVQPQAHAAAPGGARTTNSLLASIAHWQLLALGAVNYSPSHGVISTGVISCLPEYFLVLPWVSWLSSSTMCTALYSTLGTVVTWQPSTIDYLCLWLVHATMKTAMPALQHMPSAAEVALLLPHITTPVYTNSLTWVENKCSWHAWPSFKKGPLDSGYQGWPPETIGHQLQVTVPGFTLSVIQIALVLSHSVS